MIRALAIVAICAGLAGCRWWARDCPTEPVIVEVPVPVREPIPAELTEPVDASACEQEGPTVGDVRKQRRRACASVEEANARLEQLRQLGPEGER
jgi:hypothetical protein